MWMFYTQLVQTYLAYLCPTFRVLNSCITQDAGNYATRYMFWDRPLLFTTGRWHPSNSKEEEPQFLSYFQVQLSIIHQTTDSLFIPLFTETSHEVIPGCLHHQRWRTAFSQVKVSCNSFLTASKVPSTLQTTPLRRCHGPFEWSLVGDVEKYGQKGTISEVVGSGWMFAKWLQSPWFKGKII